jgi:cytochrome c-type biogenesis protein CcmH/NrfF
MSDQDVRWAVQALVVWAVAIWVVALGMVVAWLVRRRQSVDEIEEHERPADWPWR